MPSSTQPSTCEQGADRSNLERQQFQNILPSFFSNASCKSLVYDNFSRFCFSRINCRYANLYLFRFSKTGPCRGLPTAFHRLYYLTQQTEPWQFSALRPTRTYKSFYVTVEHIWAALFRTDTTSYSITVTLKVNRLKHLIAITNH